uniref:Protein kinase domain-containing protein n=1 Tax=Parastrongyloides trichosuri TaxID=131310 RepID=A0A0N4ZQW6_PARTI
MMQYAVETINSNKITTHDKKIILLTDFISLNFTNSINGYSKNNLKDILFQVYCFSKPSYYYYKNETSFAKGDVFYFSLSDPYNSFHLCLPHHTTTEQPSDGGSNIGIILISTLGTCGILFLILCGGTVLYRKRIKKNIILDQVSEYVNSVNIGDGDIYEVQWNNLFYSTEKIGNGAYGQVYKGTFMGIPLAVTTIWKCQQVTVLYKNSMPIAIKILPKNADEKARENFLHEIEIMKRIGYHDNVVGMVGCITKIQPNALIMEYCENKDLYQFVKNMKAELVINNYSIDKRLSFQRCLLTFCMQITSGMKYLVSKGIIHRDLAARNIMIDNKNNIKIGDFGLCLEIGESDTSTWMENGSIQRKNAISNTQTYKCQKLPVKWLSPESLRYTIFTHSSDVWSFGMVMYEMYSFGGVPFHDVEPSDLLNHILKGCRPEQPEFASEEIYNIMERCWNENSEERPTFDELISEFMVLLEHTTDTDVYVDLLSGSIFYKNILPELVDDVIVDDEEMENENTSSYNRRPLKQSLSANVHATTNVTNDSISRSKTMLIPDFVKRLSRDFSPNHFKQLNVKRDSFFYHDHPRRKSESIVSGTPTSPTFMDNFNEFKKTLTNSTSKIFSKRD